MRRILISALTGIALSSTPVFAEQVSRTHGGDTFLTGEAVIEPLTGTAEVFAADSSVGIDAPVCEDITVAGYSARSTADAIVQVNLRFNMHTLTIESQITAALTAFHDTVHLNAPVSGGCVDRSRDGHACKGYADYV